MNTYLKLLKLSPHALDTADEAQIKKWVSVLVEYYRASPSSPRTGLPGLRDLFYSRLSQSPLRTLIDELITEPIESPPSENYQEFLVALYHLSAPDLRQHWLERELPLRIMSQTIAFAHSQLIAAMQLELDLAKSSVATATSIRENNTIQSHEEADINTHPGVDVIRPSHKSAQLTIGDLHGNAIKLIHFLVHQNVLSISSKNYIELVDIYYSLAKALDTAKIKNIHNRRISWDPKKISDQLRGEIACLLNRFDEILQTKTKANSAGLIRFIGDVFGDRGCCDLLTLKIISWLKTNHIPFKILISNHDLSFILWYEGRHGISMIDPNHSLKRMLLLINLGLISAEEIRMSVETCYKPALQLIDYTLSADQSEFDLFMHAPVQIESLERIAQLLGIRFKADRIEHFLNCIDQMNLIFQLYVENNRLHALFYNAIFNIDSIHYYEDQTDPFMSLVWNKDLYLLKWPLIDGSQAHIIHGHEYGPVYEGYTNLDSKLGKRLEQATHLEGLRYAIFYSERRQGPKLNSRILPSLDLARIPTATRFSAASLFSHAELGTVTPPFRSCSETVAALGLG